MNGWVDARTPVSSKWTLVDTYYIGLLKIITEKGEEGYRATVYEAGNLERFITWFYGRSELVVICAVVANFGLDDKVNPTNDTAALEALCDGTSPLYREDKPPSAETTILDLVAHRVIDHEDDTK